MEHKWGIGGAYPGQQLQKGVALPQMMCLLETNDGAGVERGRPGGHYSFPLPLPGSCVLPGRIGSRGQGRPTNLRVLEK